MSTTLFVHPAARLVKSVPPTSSEYVNGVVPRDFTGLGTTRGSERTLGAILQDYTGSLQICSVPDPTEQDAATLVLVVDQQHTRTSTQLVFGAERRHVLPFRRFKASRERGTDVDDDDAVEPPQTPSQLAFCHRRPTYAGLGVDRHGTHGGSFWFFEDESEEGAADRLRWSEVGRSARAIWTVWLIGAPAPVVSHVREYLAVHPRPVKALPPGLEQDYFPWADIYASRPGSAISSISIQTSAKREANPPGSRGAPRPVPPMVPPKPSMLRVGSAALAPTAVSGRDEPSDATQSAVADKSEEAAVASIPTPADDEASMPGSFSHLLEQQPEEEDGPTTLRDTHQAQRRLSEYRNSLVAVDNETGAILGVLAQGVHLQPQSPEALLPSTPPTEDEETDEVVTPMDGAPLWSGGAAPAAGSVIRAATVYKDPDADRPHSRAPSVLGEDTFAPPPLPSKSLEVPGQRDSMASVHFFSAVESADEGEAEGEAGDEVEDDDDDEGTDRGEDAAVASGSGFVSLRGRRDLQAHQPHLLRDAGRDQEDEGAESDASGSTIGGPAVRLWRKARGKPKKTKRAKAPPPPPPPAAPKDEGGDGGMRRREASAQRSDASVRTSRAETAWEGDATEEEDAAPPAVPEKPAAVATPEPTTPSETEAQAASEPEREAPTDVGTGEGEEDAEDSPTHVRAPTSATVRALHKHGHATRAFMRTSEVRSAEDRVWRDALEAESLPIDGAYTHLAITGMEGRRGEGFTVARPLAAVGADQSTPEAGGMELLAPGQSRGRGGAAAAAAEGAVGSKKVASALQGGTVLLEFLSGSRMGASIISGAPAAELAHQAGGQTSVVAPPAATAAAASSAPLVERKGAMAYVPVLPTHLLWFFGMAEQRGSGASTASAASETVAAQTAGTVDGSSSPAAAAAAAAAVVSAGPAAAKLLSAVGPTSLLTSVSRGVSSAWDGLAGLGTSAGGWLSLGWASSGGATTPGGGAAATTTTAEASEPVATAEARHRADDDDDDDEDQNGWEWAIPEFDERSLASTPRPIYRRKRPRPSPLGGFALHAAGTGGSTAAAAPSKERAVPAVNARAPPSMHDAAAAVADDDYDPLDVRRTNAEPPSSSSSSSSLRPSRWSILHFDDAGVGRRAFVRGGTAAAVPF